MKYFLSVLILTSCTGATQSPNAPVVSDLESDEWVLIQNYMGHMLTLDDIGNGVGYAYRILGGSPPTIIEHDPYAEDVFASVKDTAAITSAVLEPLDRLIRFYRWENRPSGCDQHEAIQVTWHMRDSTFVERFLDASCVIELGVQADDPELPDEFRFEENPIMPALRTAGWKN